MSSQHHQHNTSHLASTTFEFSSTQGESSRTGLTEANSQKTFASQQNQSDSGWIDLPSTDMLGHRSACPLLFRAPADREPTISKNTTLTQKVERLKVLVRLSVRGQLSSTRTAELKSLRNDILPHMNWYQQSVPRVNEAIIYQPLADAPTRPEDELSDSEGGA